MRISVVIAAYHGEKYIAEQLESLVAQERLPDEIWIGDDSDDDATEAAVKEILPKLSPQVEIHYQRNSPRRGILGNFLNLAEQASGDLIFFSDQDDFWLPSKIRRLAGLMEEFPSMQVVGCNSTVVDEQLKPTGKYLYGHLPSGTVVEIAKHPDFAKIVWPRFAIYGHNICMRRSFLPFFQQVPLVSGVGHDIWLTQVAAMMGVMKFVDEPLTMYRVHGDNSSELTLNTLNETLLHRIRQTFRSPSDLLATMANLEALHQFCQRTPEVPEDACKILEQSWEYFRLRLRLRRFWRPFRWLALTPRLLKGYFTIGNGWRACLRDQVF